MCSQPEDKKPRAQSIVAPPLLSHSDIRRDSWAERHLPRAVGPYLRLARMDRPVGTWLLLWPCVWSTALAAEVGSFPDARLLALFAVGAVSMRGAGCTINDMWDRDIDRRVERTQTRPLASGELTLTQAAAFLCAQLLVGLGVVVHLDPFAIGVAFSSMPLVVAYPLAKRFTSWPQVVLGLTINWGSLVGWAAVHGSLSPSLAPLYASGVAWTLYYDTIYAFQDIRDDAKVGVLSSARSLGDGPGARLVLVAFAATSAACALAAGAMEGLAWPHGLAATAGGAALTWQALRLDFRNPAACLHAFRRSQLYGLLLAMGIVAGKLWSVSGADGPGVADENYTPRRLRPAAGVHAWMPPASEVRKIPDSPYLE